MDGSPIQPRYGHCPVKSSGCTEVNRDVAPVSRFGTVLVSWYVPYQMYGTNYIALSLLQKYIDIVNSLLHLIIFASYSSHSIQRGTY